MPTRSARASPPTASASVLNTPGASIVAPRSAAPRSTRAWTSRSHYAASAPPTRWVRWCSAACSARASRATAWPRSRHGRRPAIFRDLDDRTHTIWGVGVAYNLAPGLVLFALYNNINDENVPTSAPTNARYTGGTGHARWPRSTVPTPARSTSAWLASVWPSDPSGSEATGAAGETLPPFVFAGRRDSPRARRRDTPRWHDHRPRPLHRAAPGRPAGRCHPLLPPRPAARPLRRAGQPPARPRAVRPGRCARRR